MALDMGSLLAGAKFRGEFEDRLKSIMKEARAGPGARILDCEPSAQILSSEASSKNGGSPS